MTTEAHVPGCHAFAPQTLFNARCRAATNFLKINCINKKPLYLFRYSGFSYVYIQSIAAPTRPASLPSEARTSSVFVSPRKVSFSMRLRSGASSFSP